MKHLTLKAFIALAIAAGTLSSAQAAVTYTYAGTWNVHSGPSWYPQIQPILTGQDAAAFLFGGASSDYAISTMGIDASLIDFSAWVSTYGQGQSGAIVAQNYFSDENNNGIYDQQNDSSAYIQDWCSAGNCINYAFRVNGNQVPEPASLVLVVLALAGLGVTRRKVK